MNSVIIVFIFACLITITTTTTKAPANSDSVCLVNDIINTQCMGPKDCLYPHPNNCNQYIHCEVNADGQSGRPTVKDCPAGLEWNDHNKICDWPGPLTCGNNKPDDNDGFKCPAKDISEGCKGPMDCLYPNPHNCNSFIQCTVNADGLSGTPVVMPCPAGLEWNNKSDSKRCDWPQESTCNR